MERLTEWKGIRYYERRNERDELIATALSVGLFVVGFIVAALLLSGCASGSRNHYYSTNCGYAMDQEGLCKSVIR